MALKRYFSRNCCTYSWCVVYSRCSWAPFMVFQIEHTLLDDVIRSLWTESSYKIPVHNDSDWDNDNVKHAIKIHFNSNWIILDWQSRFSQFMHTKYIHELRPCFLQDLQFPFTSQKHACRLIVFLNCLNSNCPLQWTGNLLCTELSVSGIGSYPPWPWLPQCVYWILMNTLPFCPTCLFMLVWLHRILRT